MINLRLSPHLKIMRKKEKNFRMRLLQIRFEKDSEKIK